MKVGFVTADWSDIEDPETGHPSLGGSGWYRCGLPAKYLQQNGIETVIVELISLSKEGLWLHDWDGIVHDDCDVIVFQRWMHETAPGVLRKARLAGQVIVNDVDDWYWGLDHRNDAYKASDPRLHPEANRDHYWAALKESDLITVSTPFLQEKLREMPGDVQVVRNAIDLDRWVPNEFQPGKPTIGWVGSTRHRSGDLETLVGILGPFCKRHDVKFVHAGHWVNSTPAGTLAGVPEELQIVHPVVSILDYPKLFSLMDVGIVPLNQIPFNFAKSFVKGMDYAAGGVPFIAERTPEYDYMHVNHGMGLTARKPREWIRHLEAMMDDGFRRNRYDIDTTNVRQLDIVNRWVDWREAYESVL